MTRRYGRIGTVAATMLLAVAGTSGSVFAADPVPAGVVFDATLTVHFTDAVTLLPVDGATVHVTARLADAVVGEYDATTDVEGVAIIGALPIATGDGPAVRLAVTADKATADVDAESGCTLAESWHAERADVAVEGLAIEVTFGEEDQQSTSSISCPDTEPTGEVGGIIGTPGLTLPPTDGPVQTTTSTSDVGAAIVVAFIFGLAGLSLVLRRPRGNRN